MFRARLNQSYGECTLRKADPEVQGVMTRSHSNPSIGVLLLDGHLRLLHNTPEAATILEYPRKPQASVALDKVLPAIRAQLAATPGSAPPMAAEFRSGRRRYQCRAYLLDASGHGDNGNQTKIAAILERPLALLPDVGRWCEAFQLTGRESETVKLLMKGLTSKEIAEEMHISPSTVKSFLKLVMSKVGATSRTGIIAKMLAEGS
jgi:DNA-binding CsgD family transcriptional regulator